MSESAPEPEVRPEVTPAPSPGTSPTDAQAAADRLIREIQSGLSPEQAVYVVAVLANRSATELHKLARAQATATKGETDWGSWASLQNAARRLVLDAASARDGAAKLAGHQR
jgi:hypothetical protein